MWNVLLFGLVRGPLCDAFLSVCCAEWSPRPRPSPLPWTLPASLALMPPVHGEDRLCPPVPQTRLFLPSVSGLSAQLPAWSSSATQMPPCSSSINILPPLHFPPIPSISHPCSWIKAKPPALTCLQPCPCNLPPHCSFGQLSETCLAILLRCTPLSWEKSDSSIGILRFSCPSLCPFL